MATIALLQHADSRHREFYYEACHSIDAVTEVLVVDYTGATFEEARKALGHLRIRTYDLLDAMRRDGDPDMAVVTFAARETSAYARPVLEAGIRVLIEKPACLHPDEFGDLVEVGERTGAHLMLAMCNRTSPLVEDTRRIVAGDGIGRVYAACVLALADQPRIRNERRRDWNFDCRETPGGHLVFLGIHWLDALPHITGDRVEAVQAQTAKVGGGPISVEDIATLNLRLASGAQASMLSGYVLDQGKQVGISLWGADGWVRFDFEAASLEWHRTSAAAHEVLDRRTEYETAGGTYPPYVNECQRASLGEVAPPITGAAGLELLRGIFAADESAETGATVTLH